jgi:hypothetical protein
MSFDITIDGLPPASSTVTTLRFTTGLGGADASDNVWLPRVVTPGTFARHLWKPGATRGRGSVSYGVIELANIDGALDYMADWDFDGRALTVKRDGTTVFAGTMDTVLAGSRIVTVRMRDAAASIAAKLCMPTRYLGNNALPAGVEGTATDLGGKCKPLLIGLCENFAPPRVNTSLNVYQISAMEIYALYNVWSDGAAVTAGTAHATLAALLAATPTAGTFDWCLGDDTTGEGAYFRLGSAPGSGVITAKASQRSVPDTAHCALYLLTLAGVSPSDVLGVSELYAHTNASIGFWCDTADHRVGDVLDALCASVGASWAPTRAGKFQLMRFEVPTGIHVTEFYEWQLLGADAVQLLVTEDDGRGVPSYEIVVRYGRNWTVQAGTGVAGSVTEARKAWLSQEYRAATQANTAIWDPATQTGRNPTSQPFGVTSLLANASAAQTEAYRTSLVYGTKRRYLAVVLPSSQCTAVDLSYEVSIETTRFGLAGVPLVVTGLVEDWASETTTLYCWG